MKTSLRYLIKLDPPIRKMMDALFPFSRLGAVRQGQINWQRCPMEGKIDSTF